MTYDEIKKRLTEVETALQSMHNYKSSKLETSYTVKSIENLNTLKESLQKQLAEKEETMFISTKGGDTKAVAMDRKSAMDLKKDPNITGIDTAKGQKIKEQEGINFSVEETKAIAKSAGKALAIALKKAGDEIARMKARRIEENSFDINVVYKGEKGEDEFSFYISEDTLHLVDFSFDKELVDVGVKPSGEAIVNVDVLANELLKHFKSLNEEMAVFSSEEEEDKYIEKMVKKGLEKEKERAARKKKGNLKEVNYDHYTEPKHFDICPGAESLRDEVLASGKSPEELGEWTFKHDELFRLEKAVLKANKADERHVKVAKQLAGEITHHSRDLGIEANKIGYLKGHVKKIEDVANKTDGRGNNMSLRSRDIYEGEGDDHHYIKVKSHDYKKAMAILDQNIDPTYVKTEVVDDDGAGNVIIYFIFRHEYGFDDMYDDPEGKENPELYQEPDEDPNAFMYDVVMDLRANDIELADHSAELDEASQPTVFDDESFDALRDIILKYVEDPDDAEKAVQQVDDHGLDSLAPELIANLERDPEFEAWYHKLHYGPSADTDYMQRRRAEKDYQQENADEDYDPDQEQKDDEEDHGVAYDDDGRPLGEDLDIGHQDDEPSMLKSSAFETATYAAKLAKKLAQYDQVDGEVDFPNWWQKKLILARDYMSAAYHYLDSEEKQPLIDKLALEHAMNEGTELYDKNGINIKRFSGGKRGLMVQITYGGDYIHVPAEEFATLARAMQSVQGDLEDMTTQYPRSKNIDEVTAAKIQKAYGQVVAKMKELAKQYKAGDKSVVPQLKDLTAKKKELEKHLDQAVAGTHQGQELTELSGDQRNDLVELQNILDDVAQKGEEAREIIRQSFPRMLSKADAYGAFDFGSSANRYDTTLESIIEEIEEYYDEEEDDMDEGKYKSDAQRKAIYATKAEKGELKEEMDGGRLFDYFKSKGYDVTERRPDGYPPKPGVEGYQVSRGNDRYPQSVIFQHNKDTDEFTISRMSGYRIDQKDAIKAGMRQAGRSGAAGMDSYMTDGNYNPVDISAEGLKDIVDHVMTGLDREAKAQSDFYKDRGHTSGTVDEGPGGQIFPGDIVKNQHGNYYMRVDGKVGRHDAYVRVINGKPGKRKTGLHHSFKLTLVNKDELNEFKVGDKVTYLGHPGEITKVNKEMTGAITYNVAYNKGTGRTKATNIYNKGGEIKALKVNENLDIKKASTEKLEKLVKQSEDEKVSPAFASQLKLIRKELQSRKKNLQEGATCCGRCGRVHVKGTKCKRPFLTGKDHCRNK